MAKEKYWKNKVFFYLLKMLKYWKNIRKKFVKRFYTHAVLNLKNNYINTNNKIIRSV